MRTYFLHGKQVSSSIRGFLSLLYPTEIADDANAKQDFLKTLVWVAIGNSGSKILTRIFEQLGADFSPGLLDQLPSLVAKVDRDNHSAYFLNGMDDDKIKGSDVVVVDGSIRSGFSMKVTHDLVRRDQAKTITTYALAVKNHSSFIPDYFSIMIDAADRVFIQRKVIKCHKILHNGFQSEYVNIRKSTPSNIATLAACFQSPGGELIYTSHEITPSNKVYLAHANDGIGACISFRPMHDQSLCHISLLHRFDKGIGNNSVLSLVYSTEVLARNHRCRRVEANCEPGHPVIEIFKHLGYEYDPQTRKLFKDLY